MKQTGKRLTGCIKAISIPPLLFLGVAGCVSMAVAQSMGTFTATGSMSVSRVGHTATLLLNGKVLICGGSSHYSALGTVWASAELYDPTTGTFVATGNMTTLRWFHTATLLPNGQVLIAGGTASANANGSSVLGSAELYDPETGTFTAIADMTAARMNHTATLLNNGNVLIAGGRGITGVQFPSGQADTRWASAELYDPSSGTFRPTGNMTTERFNHTVTLLAKGKVLIASGEGRIDGPIPWVELYDPDTGAFSRAGATGSVNTVGPAIASVLTNGQALMSLHLYDSSTPAARLYDPATQLFTDTGNMRAPRISTATLLPTQKVLISGYAAGVGFPPPGSPTSNGLPTADLYDPDTGAFSATGEMATPRFYHTATLLPDGTVLVSGGMTSFSYPTNALASAETYYPDVLVPAPVLSTLSGNARGQGAILHAGSSQVATPDNPAIAGEALELYCTGLIDGSVIPPQVAIGGRMAEVLFFGKAPGFAGLNQVNVRVPGGVAAGSGVPVRLTYLGRSSNEVTIGMQ